MYLRVDLGFSQGDVMNRSQMEAALEGYFEPAAPGAAHDKRDSMDPGRSYHLADEEWLLAFCEDQGSDAGYLKAFERGMQALIERSRAGPADGPRLGLALAFTSTLERPRSSYRQALKKYSNSIVFEDVGISLLLVQDDGSVDFVKPGDVNEFLRRLP